MGAMVAVGAGVWVSNGGAVGEGARFGVGVAAVETGAFVGIAVSPEAVSVCLGVLLAAEQPALAMRTRTKKKNMMDDWRIVLLGGGEFYHGPDASVFQDFLL